MSFDNSLEKRRPSFYQVYEHSFLIIYYIYAEFNQRIYQAFGRQH